MFFLKDTHSKFAMMLLCVSLYMSEKYEAIPILFKEKNSPLKRLPILAPHMKSNTVSSHPKKWYGCNFSVDWPIRGPLHTHTRKGKLLCSSLAGWVPWTTLILLSWMHMHTLSFFFNGTHIHILLSYYIYLCIPVSPCGNFKRFHPDQIIPDQFKCIGTTYLV